MPQVKMNRNTLVNGKHVGAGETVVVDDSTAKTFVANGRAVLVSQSEPNKADGKDAKGDKSGKGKE